MKRESTFKAFSTVLSTLPSINDRETRIEKRYMYPNVHHSTVYNSQDMETT